MDHMNIGLLTADLDSANMGCNALTYSAIIILEEIAERLKLNFKYTLFKNIHAHSVLLYSNLDEKKIKCIPPVIAPLVKLKAMLKGKSAPIKHFNKSFSACDVFFEIAGGDRDRKSVV